MDRIFATFFMAMRYDLMKKIGGMITEIHYDKYLSSEYSEKLFINQNTPEYNNYYNNWMGCGKPGGVGNWWASSEIPFNSNNFDYLRVKAQMILLETSFSVRLKQNKVEVFDLYRRSHFIQILRISRQRIKKYLKLVMQPSTLKASIPIK